jgi:hypothetical protein
VVVVVVVVVRSLPMGAFGACPAFCRTKTR